MCSSNTINFSDRNDTSHLPDRLNMLSFFLKVTLMYVSVIEADVSAIEADVSVIEVVLVLLKFM